MDDVDAVVAAAGEFFGSSGGNGRGAPQDSGNDPNRQELAQLQKQKQEFFEQQARDDFTASFNQKLNTLTKGLEFRSDKHRVRFFSNVLQGADKALASKEVFMRQWRRLADVRGISPRDLTAHRKEAVALHMKHITDDDLRELIEEEKVSDGIVIAQKPPDGKGERREITGAGGPPSGKGLTKDTKDKKYAELEQQYSGSLLSSKWAEWLADFGSRA